MAAWTSHSRRTNSRLSLLLRAGTRLSTRRAGGSSRRQKGRASLSTGRGRCRAQRRFSCTGRRDSERTHMERARKALLKAPSSHTKLVEVPSLAEERISKNDAMCLKEIVPPRASSRTLRSVTESVARPIAILCFFFSKSIISDCVTLGFSRRASFAFEVIQILRFVGKVNRRCVASFS